MRTKAAMIAEVQRDLAQLQTWFASRPYGFREHASPQQLQQFADREREEERLQERLAILEAS